MQDPLRIRSHLLSLDRRETGTQREEGPGLRPSSGSVGEHGLEVILLIPQGQRWLAAAM